MKKLLENIFLFILIILLFSACPPQPPQPPDSWTLTLSTIADPPAPRNMAAGGKIVYEGIIRTLSLKTLQSQLAGGSTDPELLTLGGLTGIYGLFIDEANEDIILLGTSEQNLPAIFTEDLVIALRNSWLYYLELVDEVYYYSYPSCSIDPDPGLNAALDAIMADYAAENITKEEFYTQWEATCCTTPQNVSVWGMPFNTNFAYVLVHADYDMKNIVNGNDQLAVSGFTSLMDMKVAEAEKGNTEGLNFFNRFWFSPGAVECTENNGLILIEGCPVVLLTETMEQGGTETDPLSLEFVANFNAHFDAIAAKRPIFREMENLFRLFTISQVLYEKAVDSAWLSYLLDDFVLTGKTVESTLAGCSAIREVEYTDESGTTIVTLASCGGVDAAVEPVITASSDASMTGTQSQAACANLASLSALQNIAYVNLAFGTEQAVAGPVTVIQTNVSTIINNAVENQVKSNTKILLMVFDPALTTAEKNGIIKTAETKLPSIGRGDVLVLEATPALLNALTIQPVTSVTGYPAENATGSLVFALQNATIPTTFKADKNSHVDQLINNAFTNIEQNEIDNWTINQILKNAFKGMDPAAAKKILLQIIPQFREIGNR